MKNVKLKSLLLTAMIGSLFGFNTPKGWITAGSHPEGYEIGLDKGAGMDGKNAATIKSKETNIDGFVTLMQQCQPGKFSGKRVRMTGMIKAENVIKSAGLWMRIDQKGSQQPLSFDNMGDRPINGSVAWKKYDIVLDIPEHASLVAFGALLSGTGQIWMDDFRFEIVGQDIPVTGSINASPKASLGDPENLDFEE